MVVYTLHYHDAAITFAAIFTCKRYGEMIMPFVREPGGFEHVCRLEAGP